MSITLRKATPADKDFLVTAIIEAEKSGSDIISYCAIFSITEQELRVLLNDILEEDIEGQELCIGSFLIAEVDGEPAAAISAWIENETGMASNMIKSNLLMYCLDRDIIMNAAPAIQIMNEVNIHRAEHALQIECVYTAKKYRGLGLVGKLIEEHIRLKQEAGKIFDKVQVILLKNNDSARRAYEKTGFAVVSEKRCADKTILKLLSCDAKILMERKIKQ
jgi:ribosomal protein S18 acetylase RimI-like enzyme